MSDALAGLVKDYFGGKSIQTRFAPSPTGYLHRGHLLHILFVFGFANKTGAEIALRFEDHDRIRSKPEYSDAILEDLKMLGLLEHCSEPTWQSDNSEYYLSVVEGLVQRGFNVYHCDCSRKKVKERTGGSKYDGHCRQRGLKEGEGRSLRIYIPEIAGHYEELGSGELVNVEFKGESDLQVMDNHGNWTYNFCVVADDIRENINFIIRGKDIKEATPEQVMLWRAISDKKAPLYFHHQLITDQSGRKLSKRDFDEDIHQSLKKGVTAAKMLEEISDLTGKPNDGFNIEELFSWLQ